MSLSSGFVLRYGTEIPDGMAILPIRFVRQRICFGATLSLIAASLFGMKWERRPSRLLSNLGWKGMNDNFIPLVIF